MSVTQFGSRFLALAVLGALTTVAAQASAQGSLDPLGQPGSQQTEETVISSQEMDEATKPPLPPIGIMADAGLPDGLMAALVVRPIRYLRVHGGGGMNTSSAGVRGGLSVLPLGSGPSLNLEVGHYFAGEANGLVRASVQGLGRFSSYVNSLAYTFGNAHLGLDFGERHFTFFVHGGLTFVRATLQDVVPPAEVGSASGRTTVAFNQDPIVRVLSPSAKLGVVVYLP